MEGGAPGADCGRGRSFCFINSPSPGGSVAAGSQAGPRQEAWASPGAGCELLGDLDLLFLPRGSWGRNPGDRYMGHRGPALGRGVSQSVFNSKEVRLLGPSPPPGGEEATALTGAAAKNQVGPKDTAGACRPLSAGFRKCRHPPARGVSRQLSRN